MIIEIALGIVLGFLLILALPYIFALGIWAVILAAIVGIAALVWLNFAEIMLVLKMIAMGGAYLVVIVFLLAASASTVLILLGYLAYYSKSLTNWLRLGQRPILIGEEYKLLQYKTILSNYLTAGCRVGVLLIIVGLIALFLLQALSGKL